MFKRTSAALAIAALAIGASALLAGQAGAARERLQDCRGVTVKTDGINIHAAGQTIRVPATGNPQLCVTWEREINGTPTVSFYTNCGSLCFAVRVADVVVYEDIDLEISFVQDGTRHSVPVNPDPIGLVKEVEEICLSMHADGSSDPCLSGVTRPTDLSAQARKNRIELKWTASTATGDESVTGYSIYRSTTGEADSFEKVNSTTATSFKDSTVTPRTSYTYYVVALDSKGGESASSDTASATSK